MAIIFTSPKKIQKISLRIIIVLLFLILFMVPFIIFQYSGFANRSTDTLSGGDYNSDIKINFNTIDSDRVKNLEPFGDMEVEFFYIAEDKNGRQILGSVLDINEKSAIKFLENNGFKVIQIGEKSKGRKEPFIPY